MTLYQRGTWTCPASSNTSQEKWDLAFLEPEAYIAKYGITAEEYERLKKGEAK